MSSALLRAKKIAVLGLAYKANVDDNRESPAIDVVYHLMDNGVLVRANDPNVKLDIPELIEITFHSIVETLDEVDGIIILVDHREFDIIDFEALYDLTNNPINLDACGMLSNSRVNVLSDNIVSRGDGKPNNSITSQVS
jgi:UDP-N-acetyl-D-mannosaminuronate dehydrogenase